MNGTEKLELLRSRVEALGIKVVPDGDISQTDVCWVQVRKEGLTGSECAQLLFDNFLVTSNDWRGYHRDGHTVLVLSTLEDVKAVRIPGLKRKIEELEQLKAILAELEQL